MMDFIKEEIKGFFYFLKKYGPEAVIIVAATLFISLDKYHPVGNEWISTFIYYGILPLCVVIFILRKNPLDFGLRPGSPRIWGFWVLAICVVAAIILYVSSFNSSLQNYYRKEEFNFFYYLFTNCVSLSAWEFFYRGFLLFGLKEKFKEGSILLQTIPFVLLHLGKPELETVSTVITGILFGYVAYRGKSFWPAFIIHLFINVFFVALVNYRFPSPLSV